MLDAQLDPKTTGDIDMHSLTAGDETEQCDEKRSQFEENRSQNTEVAAQAQRPKCIKLTDMELVSNAFLILLAG